MAISDNPFPVMRCCVWSLLLFIISAFLIESGFNVPIVRKGYCKLISQGETI